MQHHSEGLRRCGWDDDKISALLDKDEVNLLDYRDKLILDYARILTLYPYKMENNIINNIKAAGYKDEQILLINLTVAYFNFVNRIALGLGVELESYRR